MMKEIVEPDAKSVIGDIMDLQRYVSWEIMQINSDIMDLQFQFCFINEVKGPEI